MLNLHIVIVLACFLNIIRTSAFRLMLTCLSLFNMLRCTFGALWREKECIKFGIQKCKIYVPGVQDE